MEIARILGATRNLGAPSDWDKGRSGPCVGLPIRDEQFRPGQNRMISAWHPTPKELQLIAAGAPIYLYIYGTAHPPVWVGVGMPPFDGAPADMPEART